LKGKRIVSALMICLLLLVTSTVTASAEANCISELTLATGGNSTTQLESKGYTVLFQGMNVVSDEESAVYLGYKTGGEAITDLRVSSSKSNSVQVDGITYTLVSGISMNHGTDGTPLYLYSTKDKRAGKGIAALETVTVTETGDSLDGLFNDGSMPLLDTNGKLVNLDKGITGSGLYMKIISVGCIKPYISAACLVSGNSRNEALQKAVDSGYNCFLDKDLSKANDFTYLAYKRTSDKTKAITGLKLASADSAFEGYTEASGTVNGNKLFTATGGKTPLLDVAAEALFGDTFTMGSWAKLFFASVPSTSAQTVMIQESDYSTLPKSTETCSQRVAGSSDGVTIYALYCGIVTDTPTQSVAVTESETVTAEAESETILTDETAMTDEYIEIEKTEESTEADEEPDETETAVSSVLGNGNIKFLILFSLAVVVGAIGIYIFKKRKK